MLDEDLPPWSPVAISLQTVSDLKSIALDVYGEKVEGHQQVVDWALSTFLLEHLGSFTVDRPNIKEKLEEASRIVNARIAEGEGQVDISLPVEVDITEPAIHPTRTLETLLEVKDVPLIREAMEKRGAWEKVVLDIFPYIRVEEWDSAMTREMVNKAVRRIEKSA